MFHFNTKREKYQAFPRKFFRFFRIFYKIFRKARSSRSSFKESGGREEVFLPTAEGSLFFYSPENWELYKPA